MTNGQRVLVVDGLPETEEVLKTVLEPQGHSVDRTRTFSVHRESAAPRPHVVVLHESSAHEEVAASKDDWPDVPRVIIGSVETACDESALSNREERLSHPFQYGDLIRAIEDLLAG